jgi:cytochrome P450
MSSSTDALTSFSLADPAVQACPFEFYRLMHQSAPVHYDPTTDLWVVTTYDLVQQVLRDWQTFSSEIDMRRDVGGPDSSASDALFAAEGYVVRDVLSQADPPRHTLYRNLVDRAFTRAVVERLEEPLRRRAHTLVDDFATAGRSDFLADFAVPLTLGVIADLLGVPGRDIPRFKAWTDAIIETLGLMLDDARKLECTRRIMEFQHYFVARFEEKRKAPADDLLSQLVRSVHPDGRALETEELLALVQQLLVAGNETTRNHLAKSLLLLTGRPELQDRLRAEPRLIKAFVEESLRLESPVQGLFRIVTRDVCLGGVDLPRGAKLYVCYAAANRDGAVFPEPGQLDVERGNAHRHMAFGYGIHRCIGQMLARSELQVALEVLLGRLRGLRLAADQPEPEHVPSFILRGLRSLHVEFEAVADPLSP